MSAAVASCTTTRSDIVLKSELVPPPQISKSILTCKDKPPYPKWPFTQKDVAIYINKLELTADNCKGNLKAVKKALEDYIKEVEAYNASKAKK